MPKIKPSSEQALKVRHALTDAGARRLWDVDGPHGSQLHAYAGPGGVVIVHDYGKPDGCDVYTIEKGLDLNRSIACALEWLELDSATP